MPLNSDRRRKLTELLPEGILVTPKWLIENGIDRFAIDNLIKSGFLSSVHHGVYTRGKTSLQWQAIVYSLQNILKIDVVVGGLTSLEIQGYGHYLTMSEKSAVHLYSDAKMPSWLNNLLDQVDFHWHSHKGLLGRTRKNCPPLKISLSSFVVERPWREGFKGLRLSSPERAILEVLEEVPDNISFEHANQLMQGMTSLSPRSLQQLLEQTGNVKVKRLFFWLADRNNYIWLQKLDKHRIDFGKGNRMLVKGGRLDPRYQISVPEIYE